MEFERIKEIVTTTVAVVGNKRDYFLGSNFLARGGSSIRESEIAEIKRDIQEIEKNNREILRIVGRLEGSLQNNRRRARGEQIVS